MKTPLLVKGHLKLGTLMKSRRGSWVMAWLLGMVTLIATVGLLAESGWFISATALAGITSLSTAYMFNYFGPAAIIRGFAMARTAGRYGERLASHDAVLALLADLRGVIFARLAMKKAFQVTSVKQMHRLTTDIDLLNEWPLRAVLPWLWAWVMVALWLGLVVLIAPSLLPWLVVPLLLALLVPALAAHRGVTLAQKLAEVSERRREALLQPLSALTALLQWQQWPRFENVFQQQDQAYAALALHQQKSVSQTMLCQQLLLAVAALLLLWQGGLLVAGKAVSVPLLLALLLALFGLGEILLPLGAQMMALGLSRVAIARLNALMPSENDVSNNEPARLPNALHLQAVDLSARQQGALNGVAHANFSAKNGDIVWIRGASGAGKSTLLNALAGELVLESGQLLLNGEDFSHWQWRGNIAYLAQQLDIFDLTLAQNLRLAKADASEEVLWQALDKVGLAEWARRQPQGLDTPLGEYGAAISGGQARRIALARLLLKPYPLMLLDEPFAGLDEVTRNKVGHALAAHQCEGILIFVSHQQVDFAGREVRVLVV